MFLGPLALCLCTVVLFFVFPNRLTYTTTQTLWAATHQTNLFLCLLYRSDKRYALSRNTSTSLRHTDSFGNPSLEKEADSWSFKYNSMFRPKLFPTLNIGSSLASKSSAATLRVHDACDVASDAASIYSGTELLPTQHTDMPIANIFMKGPEVGTPCRPKALVKEMVLAEQGHTDCCASKTTTLHRGHPAVCEPRDGDPLASPTLLLVIQEIQTSVESGGCFANLCHRTKRHSLVFLCNFVLPPIV